MDSQQEPDVIELGIASRETLGPIGFIAEEVLGMVVAGLAED